MSGPASATMLGPHAASAVPAAAPRTPAAVPIPSGDDAAAASGGPHHRHHRRRPARALWKTLILIWKHALGALLMMNLLTSILVAGWMQRFMQRAVFKRWHRRSAAAREGQTFERFIAADPRTAPHRHWPNWLLRQNALAALRGDPAAGGPLRRAAGTIAHSLWLNAAHGAAVTFNTFVMTLPPAALWLFAWYAGWNNSFHKGYEQAAIGPLTGAAGVILFIAAMLYVPMAQARQAAAGRWRSFYDFRLIWSLVLSSAMRCAALAALFVLFGLLVTLALTAPSGFADLPGHAEMSDAQAHGFLWRYFFLCALAVLPMLLLLRLAASRIYARGLLAAVQRGRITPDQLGDAERCVLGRLGLLEPAPREPRHIVTRAAGGTGKLAWRTTAVILMILLWLAFIAEVYVGQFLNYHDAHGWLNQPLIQLPWMNYIPPALAGG